MANKLISKTTDQKKEWDKIWKEKNLMNKLVDAGRVVYNKKWLSILEEYLDVDSFCELGCGGSTLLLQVARYAKKVMGVDYSGEALRRSRKLFRENKIKNGEFIKDNCLKLKTKRKFDVVWSQGLVEHFKNPLKIVKAHLQLTKKGGYSIMSIPYKYSYMKFWYELTRFPGLDKFWPWTDQQFFSKRRLEKMIKTKFPQYNTTVKPYPFWGVVIVVIHKK